MHVTRLARLVVGQNVMIKYDHRAHAVATLLGIGDPMGFVRVETTYNGHKMHKFLAAADIRELTEREIKKYVITRGK